jgi:hypothetical protein
VLLNSDFNLIYCAEDKNNVRLNRWQMGQFCRFLNVTSLKEIHLNRRLYTCSNERVVPTLELRMQYGKMPDGADPL